MDLKTFAAAQIDNVTIVHPLAMAALAVMGVLLLVIQRRHVLVVMFVVTLLISAEQRIAVAGLDFYFFRILIVIALLRMTLRSEWNSLRLNLLDKLIVAFVFVTCISFIALRGTANSVVNRFGYALDYIGFYLILRSLLRDLDEVQHVINSLVAITIILAIGMVLEQTVHRNFFGVFQGNTGIYWRDGQVRSVAAFAHPIAAGVFGASMVPLCLGKLVSAGRKGVFYWLGLFSACIVVITSKSSGPLLALIGGAFALSVYGFRKHMKAIRFAAIVCLIGLQMFMEAPVWALIDRVGVIGGSTSYHRYMLVDQFIRRVPEWWIFGIGDTSHWGHLSIQLWDVANQYVRVGVDGGLLAFLLFLGFLLLSYRGIGMALKQVEGHPRLSWFFWAFGSALFTHMTAFMGVSYSIQIHSVLMFTIAVCSLAYDLSLQGKLNQIIEDATLQRTYRNIEVLGFT